MAGAGKKTMSVGRLSKHETRRVKIGTRGKPVNRATASTVRERESVGTVRNGGGNILENIRLIAKGKERIVRKNLVEGNINWGI